jgi:hypothetical protein
MSAISQWSRSDFIDKSQELKRRLEHWHLDGREPMHTPPKKDFPWWIRRTFRDRVMQSEHDSDDTPSNSQTILADTYVNDLPDPCSKHLTTWLFRDFVEHLSDAGQSESAKLLRLKVDRLLDSPMNRAAKCAIGDYIGGNYVDPELLVQFLDAAHALPIELAQPANGSMIEHATKSANEALACVTFGSTTVVKVLTAEQRIREALEVSLPAIVRRVSDVLMLAERQVSMSGLSEIAIELRESAECFDQWLDAINSLLKLERDDLRELQSKLQAAIDDANRLVFEELVEPCYAEYISSHTDCKRRGPIRSREKLTNAEFRSNVDALLNRLTKPSNANGSFRANSNGDRGVSNSEALNPILLSQNRNRREAVESAGKSDLVFSSGDAERLLTVEKWSDLAIGIHEDGRYFAFCDVPAIGTPVSLRNALELNLPGKQWKNLLELLSMSKAGNEAPKKELFFRFGYCSSAPSEEQLSEIRGDENQLTILKSARQKLSAAIGDLSRKLRKQVTAADDDSHVNPPLSASNDGFVRSKFSTQCLIRDERNNLCFGRK